MAIGVGQELREGNRSPHLRGGKWRSFLGERRPWNEKARRHGDRAKSESDAATPLKREMKHVEINSTRTAPSARAQAPSQGARLPKQEPTTPQSDRDGGGSLRVGPVRL
jgi:hypothetical protein